MNVDVNTDIHIEVIISYIPISAFLPSYVLNPAKSGKKRQNPAKSVNSCSHTVCRVFWHDIFAFLAKTWQNPAKLVHTV